MPSQLFTQINETQTLETTLQIPYTLTPGRAAGSFLAAMADRRILGSRCTACNRIVVPAQDVCVACGNETPDFVEVLETGSVSTWTCTPAGCVAMVRLDGTDVDLLHRYLGAEEELVPGARVVARWAQKLTGSINDVMGFVAADEGSAGVTAGVTPAAEVPDPVTVVSYALDLPYRHAYGPYYARMFDELGTNRRLMGSRCSKCQHVLVPARAICEVCFAPTDRFVDVADTGSLQAFSVLHMEFVGQTRTPPYVYAEIVLDGSATRLIHNVAGFDIARAAELLHVGMKVRAVWREEIDAQGTLDDIEYFEPMESGS